jgi:hypothetical protein
MTESDMTRDLAWSDISVLSVDEEKRTVEYTLSDDSVDSYGEIVEQKWRLDRFKRNPVVLFSHNRPTGGGMFGGGSLSQEETLPIGRIVGKIRVEGNKAEGKRLVGTVEFAPAELNPFADKVFRMVASGYMKGGSVGFYPHDVRKEKRGETEHHVLSDNELFEFSITPLPANANAVANSLESREARRAYLERRCGEHTQPAPDGQEITMNEEQFRAKLAELEAVNVKAAADTAAATELAQAAETKAAELTAGLETARAELATKTAEIVTLTESNATLTTERDALRTERDSIESDLVELEVSGLVGVKFHAAELDDMREDRKRLGKAAFSARMAKRADLKTASPKLPADITPPAMHSEPGILGDETQKHIDSKTA